MALPESGSRRYRINSRNPVAAVRTLTKLPSILQVIVREKEFRPPLPLKRLISQSTH
jgi:hypothetical protein